MGIRNVPIVLATLGNCLVFLKLLVVRFHSNILIVDLHVQTLVQGPNFQELVREEVLRDHAAWVGKLVDVIFHEGCELFQLEPLVGQQLCIRLRQVTLLFLLKSLFSASDLVVVSGLHVTPVVAVELIQPIVHDWVFEVMFWSEFDFACSPVASELGADVVVANVHFVNLNGLTA